MCVNPNPNTLVGCGDDGGRGDGANGGRGNGRGGRGGRGSRGSRGGHGGAGGHGQIGLAPQAAEANDCVRRGGHGGHRSKVPNFGFGTGQGAGGLGARLKARTQQPGVPRGSIPIGKNGSTVSRYTTRHATTNTKQKNKLPNKPGTSVAPQSPTEANENRNLTRAVPIVFNTKMLLNSDVYYNGNLPPVDAIINVSSSIFAELRDNIKQMEQKLQPKYLEKDQAPCRIYSFGPKVLKIRLLSGC